ncbi:MAG: hypothetical protein ACODAB_06035 [Gemmatimonadota bacterium]
MRPNIAGHAWPCGAAALAAWGLVCAAAPGFLAAQQVGPEPAAPVRIDTVIVRVDNVFSERAAEDNWIFRTANAVRFQTRRGVVERELLFAAGDSLDIALLEETERILRSLDLFRTVDVDTVTQDGRVRAVVETRDAWSTLPILTGSLASDGTLTGRVGLTERNVLGTGNLLSLSYRKSTDRDGGEFSTRWRRIAATQVDVGADLALLSDGNALAWTISDPWRSLEDGFRLQVAGAMADRQRLQYRTFSAARRDTVRYRHHLYAQHFSLGIAPIATPHRVLRFQAAASVRNERYLRHEGENPPLPVPDSVFADVGLSMTYELPRYRVVGYVDGLNEQDADLTTGVTLGLRFAPEALGYERSGVGPLVALRGGTTTGPLLLRAAVLANGLFNAGGLDSGRVVASVTGGYLGSDRHATLLHVEGGVLEEPPPGREFDLGFSAPPRSFEPHAFVGTRALWGTLEHRWYALPSIFEEFGAALAGYFDFGGAWYAGQDPRWGAEFGIGLRTSSRLAPGAESSRLDVGYKLGPGIDGSRFVLSIGTGFTFF